MPTIRLKDWSFPIDVSSIEKVGEYLVKHYKEHIEESVGGVEDSGDTGLSGLTAGYVVFPAASSVVTGSSNLFWDNTNNRLSINVGTSPSVALDVLGNTSLDGAVTLNTSAADKDFLVKGDTDTGLFLVDASTNRVGISCVPSTTFENSGTFKSSGGAINLDNAVTINTSEADVDFRIAGNTATNLFFCDASTDRIGVGTATPSHKFHIDGTGLDHIEASLLLSGGTNQFIQVDSASWARMIIDSHDDDAELEFQEDDTNIWVLGFDYSDSNKFKICEGNMGTNTRFTMVTGGAATFVSTVTSTAFIIGANTLDTNEWAYLDGQDQALKTTDGVQFANINLISAGAFCQVDSSTTARFIADSSNADAFVDFQLANVTKWTAGFDYTDSNAYVISEGIPGTNNRLKIAVGGGVSISGTLALASGASINEFSTDGTMGGNSDNATPTEAAVVTYVAAQITAEDLDFGGDTGTGAVDLDSQTFTIAGTDPIDTAASSQTLTISHKTTSGNIHIPASGSSAQMLQYSSAGTAKWVTLSNHASIADGGAITIPHVTSTGSDHTYIDQSVVSGANVTFGTIGCGAITTSGAFTFSGANPDIIGGDTDGILSITADIATNQGGNIKLYGNTHASLAQDIEFYADATKVLEWDESEANWDFNSQNVKGVGTFAAGNTTLGTIGCNEITVADGHGINLQENIAFTGTTAVNKVIFPDNLPVALDFTEAGNSYMHFITTNGSEAVSFSQKVGIGTATPTAMLEIKNSNDANFFTVGLFNDNGNLSGALSQTSNGDGAWIIKTNAGVTTILLHSSDDSYFNGGNVGIGKTTFGANATKVLALGTGVDPTSSPADCFQMYSADVGGVADEAGVHFRDELGLLTILGGGGAVLDKTTGKGIKVDTTTPTFGWRDLLGDQFSKNTGGTKPLLTTYNGDIDAWQFSNGDEAFLTFHIPHDYVAGTDIHLHVHWSQNNAGATGGTIDFKYFAIYAKGHNQASGSAFTSTPITATFSSININDGGAGLTRYQQHFTEVVISAATATGALFDRDDFEPDGVIELTLEMDANNLTGTASDPFIHYVDLHYQSTNIGTKDKAPDFYS